MQRTIKNIINIEGVGLHSGKICKLEIHPANENEGLNFIRIDVCPNEKIKAVYNNVQNTMLATSIVQNGIEIKTIEHLFAALSGLQIDNALIIVDGPEIPILDGSSRIFVEKILETGIVVQNSPRKYLVVKKEVCVRQDDAVAKLVPYSGSKFSFKINYNNVFIDKTPSYSSIILENTADFIEQISDARTFGFEKEINYLKSLNLIIGGSLENAIVVQDDSILNNDGLRMEDEFVKHKILDAIGDLYLSGFPILGAYEGHKSGHRLNNELLRALMSDPSNFEITTL